MRVALLLLLAVCCCQTQSKAVLEQGECYNPLVTVNRGTLHFKVKGIAGQKGDSGGPGEVDIGELKAEIKGHISTLICTELAEQNNSCQDTDFGTLSAASSCKDIYSNDSTCCSGYYWLQGDGEGSAHMMYCEMEECLCGSVGGWTKVATLNTSKENYSSPYPLTKIGDMDNFCKHSSATSCDLTTFNTYNISYCEVCGRVQGYQLCRCPGCIQRHIHRDSMKHTLTASVSRMGLYSNTSGH